MLPSVVKRTKTTRCVAFTCVYSAGREVPVSVSSTGMEVFMPSNAVMVSPLPTLGVEGRSRSNQSPGASRNTVASQVIDGEYSLTAKLFTSSSDCAGVTTRLLVLVVLCPVGQMFHKSLGSGGTASTVKRTPAVDPAEPPLPKTTYTVCPVELT